MKNIPTSHSTEKSSAECINSTNEGMRLYEELMLKKTQSLQRFRRIGRTVLLSIDVLFGLCVWFVNDNFLLPLIISGFFTLASFLSAIPLARLTRGEYYAIDGTQDSRGGHICVKCGHTGLYRHTQYKTNTLLADCSRCQLPLWQAENE